jgi:hypothetical protein
MARIITIPNDNDPVMNLERQRIAPWAGTHNWIYVGYNDQNDHIAQIRRVSAGSSIDVIDCDCHGNPTIFDHTTLSSAFLWGKALSQSTGFSGNSAIYLDACNTGLTSAYGGPIAQAVANGARCTVFGTRGYMTGTFAEGNEKCFASASGLPPYPGAQDASGPNVWIAFHPQVLLKEEEMNSQISLNLKSESTEALELTSILESIINTEPIDFPNLRIAPDITLNYQNKDGVIILDVYANGGLLKDRVKNITWKVHNPEQLQSMVRTFLSK